MMSASIKPCRIFRYDTPKKNIHGLLTVGTQTMGLLNISIPWHIHALGEIDISDRWGWSKKSVQQGRESLARSRRGSPLFDTRSVFSIREHGKKARTPLAAFFIPCKVRVLWLYPFSFDNRGLSKRIAFTRRLRCLVLLQFHSGRKCY